MSYPTCKTCRSWNKITDAEGLCQHQKVGTCTAGHDELSPDPDDHCINGTIETGPDFGCIHHSSNATTPQETKP